MKYKIKRRNKTIKTSYIFITFTIVLMFLSISYAAFATTLRINGTATGEWQQLSVTYLHIDNSSSYPSTIRYMETYSYTFANPPTIESVTMGGIRLTLGTDYTYANGTLTIPDVTGALVIDGEEPELQDFSIKYVYGDNIEFDGASWIDTGVALFSQENFDRDFELTVNVVSSTYDSSQRQGQNTIFNCVNHQTSPYHGMLLRRDASKYYLKVTDSATNVNQVTPSLADVQNIKVTRTNKKVYADVTNASNLVEVGDFNNFTQTIDSELYIGSDMNKNKPDKCFKGVLSNITLTNYYEAEEAPVALPNPQRTGYNFGGWYYDSAFTNRAAYGGESYTPTGDTVLYAKWIDQSLPPEDEGEDEYVFNGQYNFAQNGPINTHVHLYTQENIHRNFEMSFNIVSIGNNNNDTLMSATKNVLSISNASSEKMLLDTTGGSASNSQVKNIPNTITNVRLVRINDKLYYSLNGQTFLEINNYSSSTSYSPNPVLFGADFDQAGEIYRQFDGILSNMSVRFISDSATITSYQPTHGQLATIYSQSGPTVFDGTNDIDLNVRLFDYDSYDKDFEISFNIDSIASDCVPQATLVNSKYENQQAGYPGFVYRLDSNKAKLELTAAKATSGSPYAVAKENVQSVKIVRRDMKLYASINGETERQVYDFTGFRDFCSTTVTIGSAGPDGNGGLFRPFKGTLSDIVVKMEQ